MRIQRRMLVDRELSFRLLARDIPVLYPLPADYRNFAGRHYHRHLACDQSVHDDAFASGAYLHLLPSDDDGAGVLVPESLLRADSVNALGDLVHAGGRRLSSKHLEKRLASKSSQHRIVERDWQSFRVGENGSR